MNFKRITYGTLVETFNDAGELIGAKVLLNPNSVEYETEDGDEINVCQMPDGITAEDELNVQIRDQ